LISERAEIRSVVFRMKNYGNCVAVQGLRRVKDKIVTNLAGWAKKLWIILLHIEIISYHF
jgi:hypothetical protein